MSNPPEVWLLQLEGIINPLTARYIGQKLRSAQTDPKPQLIIVELSTPGGLETSMRDITQAILTSSVPIAVYVAPGGARAASAGLFITLSADIAVMAPGTNIGAAHPVAVGANQQQDPNAVMKSKAVNDAAALARALAKEKGRNADWAESAVRQSVSITADEAVEKEVIDFVAPNLDGLLSRVHGQKIQKASGFRILHTRGARVIEKPMNLAERIMHTITDPNIAYLLMTIGFIGLIAELYSPGMIFPGLFGGISLILAFTALGSLPMNWAGVLLLASGVLLLVLDLVAEGFGVLGVLGLAAFVLGSLILYRPIEPVSPSAPYVAINPWLIGAVSLSILGFLAFVLRAVIKARRLPIAMGPKAIIGKVGLAITDLSPSGKVRIDSEEWSAVLGSDSGGRKQIKAGEQVEVVGIEGVTLKVSPHHLGQHLQAS